MLKAFHTAGSDGDYQFGLLRAGLLFVLLPFSLFGQVCCYLFDLIFPKPLRWNWDNAANPGRKKIDTWNSLKFPDGFLWGTATAAHQVCQSIV
jgi:hypothetical protein